MSVEDFSKVQSAYLNKPDNESSNNTQTEHIQNFEPDTLKIRSFNVENGQIYAEHLYNNNMIVSPVVSSENMATYIDVSGKLYLLSDIVIMKNHIT